MAAIGYTPIQLYYSTTASAVPVNSNLANGELAINITDGKLYYKDNTGTVKVVAGTGGTGIVAGSNTQVQYNNGGVFGASSNMTFDGTSLTLGGNPTLSAGTANGVTYLNGSKVLTSGSALTFDGTTFALNGATIGTRLAVKGTGAFGGFDTGAATDGRIEYAYNGTNIFYTGIDSSSLMTLMARSSVSLAFGANGSEQMRLTSTGLKVGTTGTTISPVTVQATNVNGYGFGIINDATNNTGKLDFLSVSNGGYTRIVGDGRSTGYIAFQTNDTERFRITSAGAWGLSGANYGTSGQVLTSGGSGAAPTWTTVSGGGSVGGSNGQVQFNNSGSFGGVSELYWDNTNKRLGINVGTSPTEALTITGRIKMGINYVVSDSVTSTFYISTTGSDSTGTGTNANPWATINKAMESIPRLMPNGSSNAYIVLKNGTYTLSSTQYIRGIVGGGTLYIQAQTAGSVTVNLNGYQYEIDRNNAEINFSGITFQTATTPSMFNIRDTLRVTFTNSCAVNQMVSGGSSGNFNAAFQVERSGFILQCPLTVTNEASYGAVINIYSGSTYAIQGTISKSGARHGNSAVSVQGNAEGQFQSTINNFAIGINMGQSHYDAETFGIAVANNLSLTNCNIGIRLSNNGVFKNYYIASTSGTTTPVYWVNGWYSGQYGSEYVYIGYNTSVSSSYRLQVNSQIYATSSTIATSDGRYKKNVASIANGLDLVKALRPVQFDWIPHDIHNFDTEHTTVGFIAQEVKEVLAGTAYVDSIVKPHYITREAEEYETIIITPATEEVIDERGRVISLAAPPVTEKRITKPAVTEEFFGIAEGNLIAILTKAIQEQQVIIEALTARVEALEAK